MLLTGVTPGSANPRHAISLSKSLGQPWESRPRALSPRPAPRSPLPPAAGSREGNLAPGPLCPESQRGCLRLASCGPGIERSGRGPRSTLPLPSAVVVSFCLPSSEEGLSGRREPEDCLENASNKHAYWLGHRSQGSAIARVPRPPVNLTNTAPDHISASWFTSPFGLPWQTAFSILTQRRASLLL